MNARRPNIQIFFVSLVFLSGLTNSGTVLARDMNIAELVHVDSAETPRVVIHPDQVVRNALPETLFGFNINVVHFQKDLWDESKKRVKPSIVNHLKAFDGALYRYPGGLVSNRFNWQWSVGPSGSRKGHKLVKWAPSTRIDFGLDEYLEFVKSVNGHPWFVLNLVGWDEKRMIKEMPIDDLSIHNAKLAKYIKGKLKEKNVARYYQLGNELDRSKYQWSHDKYILRSRRVIESMLEVDPDARFVAFLRDFNWKYRAPKADLGKSRAGDFIRDVLTGLEMVNDFSLHYYYDGADRDREISFINRRLAMIVDAIEKAKSTRRNKGVNVWITEHAHKQDKKAKRKVKHLYTSSLASSLSTADFLIAIAQIPEIKGANWHALNGGQWLVFDAKRDLQNPVPRPIYQVLRVLKKIGNASVLATKSYSPNDSLYPGGYDIRAVGFRNNDAGEVGAWIVNRSARGRKISLVYDQFKNIRKKISHYYVAGKGSASDVNADMDVVLDGEMKSIDFDSNGAAEISIPGYSVSTVVIKDGN